MFSACAGAVNKPWAPGRQPLTCIAGKALSFLCICHRYLKVEKNPHTGGKNIHGCVTFPRPCNTPSLKNKITRLKKNNKSHAQCTGLGGRVGNTRLYPNLPQDGAKTKGHHQWVTLTKLRGGNPLPSPTNCIYTVAVYIQTFYSKR